MNRFAASFLAGIVLFFGCLIMTSYDFARAMYGGVLLSVGIWMICYSFVAVERGRDK